MKVLLVGESCIDQIFSGIFDYNNPDGAFPKFITQKEELLQGMAANVSWHLATLFGAQITSVHQSNPLIRLRIFDTNEQTYHLRINHVNDTVTRINIDQMFAELDNQLFDAIVISDYDKGFLQKEDIQDIFDAYPLALKVLDSKKQHIINNFDFLKLNEHEYNNLKSDIDLNKIIITQGARGASLNNYFIAADKIISIDHCGAGDVFLAAFTYFYWHTGDWHTALQSGVNIATSSCNFLGAGFQTARKKEWAQFTNLTLI